MIGNSGASAAVLFHLREHGEITQREAISLYGCYRLAARIHEFREAGYIIDTIMEDHKNRYGRVGQHARYVLAKEQRYGKFGNKVSSENV